MKATLLDIRNRIIENHQSLYLDDLDEFINKVNLFGFYFATLDIRQNSKIHDKVIKDIVKVTNERQLSCLLYTSDAADE